MLWAFGMGDAMAKRQFLGRDNEVDIRHIPDGTWLDCVPDGTYEPKSDIRPSEALNANREAVRRIVAVHNGRNPRVFGSVTTGEDTVYSDLDLLVERVPGTSVFEFYDIASEIEDLLGVKVDLISPGALPKRFRREVLDEAKPLCARHSPDSAGRLGRGPISRLTGK